MSDDDEKPPYGVGYGKPPVEHRFTKGKSGNGRGRPRKPVRFLSQRQLVLDVIKSGEQLVKVRRRGKTVEIPLIEAVWESVAAKAASGHAPTQRFFLKHYAEATAQLYRQNPEKMQLIDKLHDDLVVDTTGDSRPADHALSDHFKRRTYEAIGQYNEKKDPYLKEIKRQQEASRAWHQDRAQKGIVPAVIQAVDLGLVVSDASDGRQLLIAVASLPSLAQALGARGPMSTADLADGLGLGLKSYDDIRELLRASGVQFTEEYG